MVSLAQQRHTGDMEPTKIIENRMREPIFARECRFESKNRRNRSEVLKTEKQIFKIQEKASAFQDFLNGTLFYICNHFCSIVTYS